MNRPYRDKNRADELHLVVETHDSDLIADIMETTKVEPEYRHVVADIGTLEFRERRKKRTFGNPETLEIIISIGTGTASSVLAAWLYNKLQKRVKKVTINRVVLREVSRDELERTIEFTTVRTREE